MAVDFKSAGEKLISSGEKQELTGDRLIAYANDFRAFGGHFKEDSKLDKAVENTEKGLLNIRGFLTPIINVIRNISNILSSIQIPDLDIFTRRIDIPVIGRITVVTGVNVGTSRPFRTVANNFRELADDINDIRNTLGEIAIACNEFQADFGNIHTKIESGFVDIKNAGQSLKESGAAMKEVGALLKA